MPLALKLPIILVGCHWSLPFLCRLLRGPFRLHSGSPLAIGNTDQYISWLAIQRLANQVKNAKIYAFRSPVAEFMQR
jgi:hypothetical protein